jgi:hypothetical protein
MAVVRRTLSLDSGLAQAVREAAHAESITVSEWLAQAARRRLALRELHEVVVEMERQGGPFAGATFEPRSSTSGNGLAPPMPES